MMDGLPLRAGRGLPVISIVALGILWGGTRRHLAHAFPTHEIIDAEADIRELDVGDLSDMESDVPPTFIEEQKRQKTKMPSMAEIAKDPMEWATSSQSGMQMTFTTLKQEKAEELGKAGTDRLASLWKSMLETGGVNAQVYAVDPGKILFVTNGPGLVGKVRDFSLAQEETDWFEKDQKQFFPEGRSAPLMDNDARKVRELELGWRKAEPAAEEKKKGSKSKSGKKKK